MLWMEDIGHRYIVRGLPTPPQLKCTDHHWLTIQSLSVWVLPLGVIHMAVKHASRGFVGKTTTSPTNWKCSVKTVHGHSGDRSPPRPPATPQTPRDATTAAGRRMVTRNSSGSALGCTRRHCSWRSRWWRTRGGVATGTKGPRSEEMTN